MATQVSMGGHSWWYHWAVLGKSVGVAIGTGAGVAMLFPPAAPVAGVVAGIASVVTGYANKGVVAEETEEKQKNEGEST